MLVLEISLTKSFPSSLRTQRTNTIAEAVRLRLLFFTQIYTLPSDLPLITSGFGRPASKYSTLKSWG